MITITFVSNYINHHQLPFCKALDKHEDVEFHFIQTMPMEEKRVQMGWAVDVREYPFVELLYENREYCQHLIDDSDVVLLGWSDMFEIEKNRLGSGKLTFRVSERIYREGQYKAISPKGLIRKYKEHVRYKNKPVYLLCTGAYVASDYELIHAYPGKMLKWGYFPESMQSDHDSLGDTQITDAASASSMEEILKMGRKPAITILWAGRLIALKHPEFAVLVAEKLVKNKYDFHLNIVGDGDMRPEVERLIADKGLTPYITLFGNLEPAKVREQMQQSDIFLFTSCFLEGWGAVVNEAMDAGCAVVASKEAGAVPFLIQSGYNGLTFDHMNYREFEEEVLSLMDNSKLRGTISENAKATIHDLWNAQRAADRLVAFSQQWLAGKAPTIATNGPMSRAHNLKPQGFWRSVTEHSKLQ